jgi:hypothetical protein
VPEVLKGPKVLTAVQVNNLIHYIQVTRLLGLGFINQGIGDIEDKRWGRPLRRKFLQGGFEFIGPSNLMGHNKEVNNLEV